MVITTTNRQQFEEYRMKAIIFALFIVSAVADEECHCRPHNVPFGECPEVNGENSTYLMDLNRRNVFYECDNGVPYEQKCPAGLVFNPILNVCDYPCLNCEPYGPVGTCPKRETIFLTYLRDGLNIKVFYVCMMGKPARYNCSEGKMYNTQLKVCIDVV